MVRIEEIEIGRNLEFKADIIIWYPWILLQMYEIPGGFDIGLL